MNYIIAKVQSPREWPSRPQVGLGPCPHGAALPLGAFVDAEMILPDPNGIRATTVASAAHPLFTGVSSLLGHAHERFDLPPGHEDTKPLDLPFQLDAGMLENTLAHGLPEILKVISGCMADIDHEIAVQR